MSQSELTKDSFATDQDIRWCPGCGDYSILAAVQRLLPSFGLPPEQYVFVSGIGCSSRFPYYMNTYGFHTIHGRAPSVATGIKVTNPELSVWIVTGDGDALSIGGNHLLHILRRNVDCNILLFNNRIYGLTKGQYSPTSELGKVTKSSPLGSVDYPINPIRVALGSEASFVARTLDSDPKHMTEVLREAMQHRGTSFVEVCQNCVIFNDGAFLNISDKGLRTESQLLLKDGDYLVFGKEKNCGIAIEGLKPKLVTFEPGKEEQAGVIRHDSSNPILAAMLSTLAPPEFPTPMGVLFKKVRPIFNDMLNAQQLAQEQKAINGASPDIALRELFESGDTWVVEKP